MNCENKLLDDVWALLYEFGEVRFCCDICGEICDDREPLEMLSDLITRTYAENSELREMLHDTEHKLTQANIMIGRLQETIDEPIIAQATQAFTEFFSGASDEEEKET